MTQQFRRSCSGMEQGRLLHNMSSYSCCFSPIKSHYVCFCLWILFLNKSKTSKLVSVLIPNYQVALGNKLVYAFFCKIIVWFSCLRIKNHVFKRICTTYPKWQSENPFFRHLPKLKMEPFILNNYLNIHTYGLLGLRVWHKVVGYFYPLVFTDHLRLCQVRW